MDDIPEEYFSIIVLPDTQEYVKSYPAILRNQIRWIENNIDSLNIKFVIQTGDIVDTGKNNMQWKMANKTFRLLDGKIPYLLVPGNHDYNGKPYLRDLTSYNQYFNYSKFENYSWYGGHYPSNGNQNNFGLLDTQDEKFLVLGLDFCPTDDVLTWANNTIDMYQDRKVIVFTHSYLSSTGDRVIPEERDSCNFLGVKGNEGEDIWNKLVKQHQNIILIVSGHKAGDSRRIDYIYDYPINQLEQNYQKLIYGGNGLLRIYTFIPKEKIIDVKTYSPYINEYDLSATGQFNLTYK